MADTRYDSQLKTWFGPKDKEYYGSDMTLGEVILYICQLEAGKVLQVDDTTGESLTGQQLGQRCRRLAHALQRLKLQRGDVVGISVANTSHLTELVVAALLDGLPINPLHPNFDSETVGYMYEITKPKVIFCDLSNYEILQRVADRLTFKTEIMLLEGSLPGVRNIQQLLDSVDDYDEKSRFACPHMSGDDTAFIISSSGVTGLPKGVTRSHRSLLNNTKIPQLFTAETVLFCFSPLYWISCVFTLLASLVNGCKRIITNRPFSVDYFLDLVSRYQISFIITVPHHMALLAKSQRSDEDISQQLASIKSLMCSGSKVPRFTWNRMYELLGSERFIVLYGLSEVGGVSKNVGGPVGSEGKLLRDVQAQILDENGSPLGPNETGHIHIRLAHRWGGYYRNPLDTQTALTSDGKWLLTGDHGYFDSECNLHFETRDTDVFKCNNFQIYPKQIEEVIMQLPGVDEVGVFGVPDDISTNLTACAIVKTPNEQGEQLEVADVVAIVEQHLSEIYHLRGGVYFVKELPKTTNNKIRRRRILKELKANYMQL